jgi:hypothetical protein
MPFEKRRNSTRKSRASVPQKRQATGFAVDPWSVVLKVRSWATQLKAGKVHSCAEIARREGITRARVSQIWPLLTITRERAESYLRKRKGRYVSLRILIKFARSSGVKMVSSGVEKVALG